MIIAEWRLEEKNFSQNLTKTIDYASELIYNLGTLSEKPLKWKTTKAKEDQYMLKWFNDCKSMEEAKETYKRLCRKYHPDLNESDTTAEMQSINSEFEKVFEVLKNNRTAESNENPNGSAADMSETPAEFINIINELINCDGVEIDLVGRWIWLAGNTYPYKDIIKSLNFKWAHKKKAWYWHRAEDTCKSRSSLTLDEVKKKYGCKSFKASETPRLQATNI